VTYDPAVIDRRPRSMAHLFLARVAASPDEVAYYYPVDDAWQASTWSETHQLVEWLAAGLVATGVQPEECVALVADTRFEWILSDLAIMCAGAATTTIFPTSTDADVAHILDDCGARVVIAENVEQVQKLWRIRSRIRHVKRVILLEGEFPDDRVLSLESLLRLGERHLEESPDAVAGRLEGVRREGLATIMYTSGTTGTPKGVRLRHSSWTYEGTAIAAQGVLDENDLQLLSLPLSHSFGKVLLSTQLACGFPTAVDGRMDRVIDNLAVVRPTFMAAPPELLEKAHARIVASAEEEGGLKKRSFDQAFAVARRVRRHEAEGTRVPYVLARRHRLLDTLVFAGIRAVFGDRLRFMISGAAGLDQAIAEFFDLAGVTILEGYGLTESSGASFVSLPDDDRIDSVGQVFPGTEVEIAADGEILLSGPGVMDGYHNLPEETAAVLRHGWLHTGDVGELDERGRLRIIGRKKDLFKTAQGTYVAPGHLEGRLKAGCRYLSHAVVVGAGLPYCVAVVTLDPETVAEWAGRRGLGRASYDELVRLPEVLDLVVDGVERLNASVNPWEIIKRFVIADADLTIEAGELTPSMKVRRAVVEERYADRIRALYPAHSFVDQDYGRLADARLSGHLAG
jgi:long-chain acyl-CoA synthetase